MIKVLALIMLLVAGNAFAGGTEPSPFNGKHQVKPIVYTECKAGHLFIIAASPYGVAIQEIFQDTDDMVPKPIECKEDENKETD